ncbi:unnamed protein product [Merluccius merluccius]
MEGRLADFRARRAAAQLAVRTADQTQTQANTGLDPGPVVDLLPTPNGPGPEAQENPPGPQIQTVKETPQDGQDWLLDSALGRRLGCSWLAVTNLTLLKLLLWLVLLGLFAELDFGLPFFLVSLFYWMYVGLRSPAARQPGELSAYSVFNPGCRPLLGAITAEQLEGEMGYRPLANR